MFWTAGGKTHNVVALDRFTGDLIWSNPGKGDTHANTVLFEDGAIYYVTGDDGNFGVKLQLSEDGTEISELWRNKKFDSYMGGIVKVDSYLYDGINKPQLWSVDAATGVIVDSVKIGRGVVIEADQMLYYYNFKGKLKLVS